MNFAKDELIIGAGVAIAAIAYMFTRGPAGVGSDIGQAAGTAVGAVATGAVVGLGATVGIPQTNLDQCQTDLANGDTLKASFSCPASTFLKSTLGF